MRVSRKSRSGKGKAGLKSDHKIRMGQLLGPYGVGSIYPCDASTVVMVAGLDAFDERKLGEVHDVRLCKRIGVNGLRLPPVFKNDKDDGFIPVVRFPGWMYCPKCGRMRHVGLFENSRVTCDNPDCKHRLLVPERFIVVCPHGHVDDFPVMEWVHHGQHIWPGDPEHVVTRKTGGGIGTMGDVRYKCTCGETRTLKGAMDPYGPGGIKYHCRGRRPWLGKESESCDCETGDLRVAVMGASNVCYNDTVSSVLIPGPVEERAKTILLNSLDILKEFENSGMLRKGFELIAKTAPVEPDALALAYEQFKDVGDAEQTEADYLYEEYLTLKYPDVVKNDKFSGNAVDIGDFDSPFLKGKVSSFTLAETLTVTRALVGLTRLSPEGNEDKSMRERRGDLSKQQLDWTLAVQNVGEGIFLEIDGETLEGLCGIPAVKTRVEIMQQRLDGSRRRRRLDARAINPKFVITHTLAHLLLLAISEVCGYSASSIRERVYCERFLTDGQETHDDMHGLLIYTASETGEGSLGGLVRTGRPGRFEDVFRRALEDALWCSGDPVCIESKGQGPDSCNLAACYNCALVPETSCEVGNRFLDRALIVGTLDDPSVGLFGPILRGDDGPAV